MYVIEIIGVCGYYYAGSNGGEPYAYNAMRFASEDAARTFARDAFGPARCSLGLIRWTVKPLA